MGSYKYTNIMEYLPKRYAATPQQERERRTIYNFKDGYCSQELKDQLIDKINYIKSTNPNGQWRVCFIPASSHLKTIRRYRDIARYIERKTSCSCDIDTITTNEDRESGYLSGKRNNPAENFTVNRTEVSNQNIILIDDIITRGNTFIYTADKLVNNGAKDVIGLFVAKTINPDWVA